MPYAKRKRTTTTKRVSRKHRTTARPLRKARHVSGGLSKPSQSIQRGFLSADNQFVKIKYNGSLLVSTGVSIVPHIFSGNGCYDPDITSVGHQPRGWDQWAALYSRYTCFGSKVQASFISASTEPFYCVICPFSKPTTVTNPDITTYKEVKYAKTAICNKTGKGQVTLHSYMSTSKILGIPPSKVGTSENLSASISSVPGAQWNWHCGATHLDHTSTLGVYINFTVTYYVKFWERIVPALS